MTPFIAGLILGCLVGPIAWELCLCWWSRRQTAAARRENTRFLNLSDRING